MRAKFAGVTVILAALLLPATASAQTAEPSSAQSAEPSEAPTSDGSRVVATVNDHAITAQEVRLAADDIMAELSEVPSNLRFAFVVEHLIERHLLAQAAAEEGITETDEYKRRLAFYKSKALRDAYFASELKPRVTEELVRQTYDEQAAKVNSEERVRARHILVASEQEARDIAARVAKGEDFEELAKTYSLDGSKEYGGDLGYFNASEMVAPFSEAAFALQPGEVSDPVQTEYGWHVIKVEDRRVGGAQPYDDVKDAIEMVLTRKQVQDKVLELRQTAQIEVFDEDLKRLQQQTEQIRDQIDEQLERSGAATGGAKQDLAE